MCATDHERNLSLMFIQLMPSPKWKLVVDVGAPEDPLESTQISTTNEVQVEQDIKDAGDLSILDNLASAPVSSGPGPMANDNRVNEVIGLLGEFTPSDPNSPLSPYLSGFMTLRLLLLRQSRTPEEEEFVRTMLDSFSSYTAGGRERSDIAIMLARDCMFLQQQQPPAQEAPVAQSFLSVSRASAPQAAADTTGLSVFCLPSISSSLQNSPALTPIPAPAGNLDSMSIVSN